MRFSFDIVYIYISSVILLVLAVIFVPLIQEQRDTKANTAVGTSQTTKVAADNDASSTEPSANTIATPSSEAIGEAKNFYSVTLPILLSTYNVQYSPVQANEASWNAFTTRYPDVIDPQTSQPPKFTTGEPGIGEVQYAYPAKCVSAFEYVSSPKSYALKTKIGDKHACISSIYKYIEE